VLRASREIIKRLEADGWRLNRVRGSHHIFRKAGIDERIVVPHPRKDLGNGLVRKIYKDAGWRLE
jgi:predicted RNA binding protein YcfA (HicA-like mRNA interferase family)